MTARLPFAPGPPSKEPDPYGLSAGMSATSRRLHEFDVSAVLKLPSGSGRVKIRVPTKREQDVAIAGAWRYVEELARDNPRVATDTDVVFDAKSAFIVHAATRDADQPEKLPAFYSPDWIIKHLTTDAIGYLVNLVNEVRRADGPEPKSLDDEHLETLVSLCVATAGSEIPERAMAGLNREALTQAFVLLALKLDAARRPQAVAEVAE